MMEKYIPRVSLDKNSALPLYAQLVRNITDDILKSNPNPGSAFVSQRQLAEELELNRLTVNKAYKRLIEDGILIKEENSRALYISKQAVEKIKPTFPAIGIILPCDFSEYVGTVDQTALQYVSGILDRAAQNNYAPMLLKPPSPDASIEEIQGWIDNYIPRLSGMIHLGDRGFENDRTLAMILQENSLPQVFISGYSDNPNIGTVCCDIESGIDSFANYIKELGYKSIGVIGDEIPAPTLFRYAYSYRTQRAIDRFRANNIELRDEWIMKIGMEESTHAQIKAKRPKNPRHLNWLNEEDLLISKFDKLFDKRDNIPTLFWCSNDFCAIKLQMFLKRRGFSVPRDISIVGMDNNIEAEFAEVPLTTIRVPMYEMGCKAFDLVLEHLYDGISEKNRIIKVPTSLIIRKSLKTR